jgi:hypothetical protein
MRLYEFDDSADPGHEYAVRISLALDNLIGRSASKGQAANYNWAFLNQLPELKGLKLDQSTFAKIYDKYPMVKGLVRNFDSSGVNLKVPGVSQEKEEPGSDIDKSKEKVNQAAASAAPKQLAKAAI